MFINRKGGSTPLELHFTLSIATIGFCIPSTFRAKSQKITFNATNANTHSGITTTCSYPLHSCEINILVLSEATAVQLDGARHAIP